MKDNDKNLDVVKQEVITEDGIERTRSQRVYIPRTGIYEVEDAILLVANLPGVDKSSVDITLEKNLLTIKGYVEEDVPEGYSLAYAEYEIGDYERSFTLSDEIDREHIEAEVKDGVLRLRLPKAEPAMAKKIAVKAG
ncbi:MAG: Hsp20/alpha crystallin family protein [Anaerolineales bacterium]|nr:Hsp20/alpha crystallin family protein [Anaerolineales bacterium]